MDYGLQIPEINSGRIYAGAGSGPLMATAASWAAMAAEMMAAAGQLASVLGLLSANWSGPSSEAMAASLMPYLAWMLKTAEMAEHAATTHAAVGLAHEAAWANVVSPPVIAENRARLASLASTNFMGVNTAAIAATEAQYAEMWAQDAGTLYTYADTLSAAVGGLQGDAALPALPTGDPAGLAGAVTDPSGAGSGLTSALGQAGGMGDPSSMLGQVMGMAQAPMSAVQGLGSGGGGGLNPGQIMSQFSQFLKPDMLNQAVSGLGTGVLSGMGSAPAALSAASVGPGAGMGPVTGQMGQASLLRGTGPRMSVPANWAEAAKSEPRVRIMSAQEVATEEAAAPRAMSAGGMPGMLAGAGAGSGQGGSRERTLGNRVVINPHRPF